MNEVSPVTEAEVTTFAQRIVTTIVANSDQAHQLILLREQMDHFSSKLNKLYDENTKLKNEMAEAWEFVKTVEAERDQAKRNAELSEARVAEAQQDAAKAYSERDKITWDKNAQIDGLSNKLEDRDNYIAKLERELAEANSHVTSLKATNEEQAFRIVKMGESLHHRQETIDRFSIELHDTHKALDASNTKLGNVQAKLNDLRSLFDSPKEATLVGDTQGNVHTYTAF